LATDHRLRRLLFPVIKLMNMKANFFQLIRG
jgi:hypothetical protein